MEMSGVPLTAQVSTDSLGSFTEAPGPPRKRKKYTRWNIPQEALSVLEEMYWKDKFPSVETRKALAEDLKVTPRQVQRWFQNKRQRAIKRYGSGGMMDEGDEPAPQARSNVAGRGSQSVDLTRQQTELETLASAPTAAPALSTTAVAVAAHPEAAAAGVSNPPPVYTYGGAPLPRSGRYGSGGYSGGGYGGGGYGGGGYGGGGGGGMPGAHPDVSVPVPRTLRAAVPVPAAVVEG